MRLSSCKLFMSALILLSSCQAPVQIREPEKVSSVPAVPQRSITVSKETKQQIFALPEYGFAKVQTKEKLQNVRAAVFNIFSEEQNVRFGSIDLQVLVIKYNKNQLEHVVVEFGDEIVYDKVYGDLLVYYNFSGRVVQLPIKGGQVYLREMKIMLPQDI